MHTVKRRKMTRFFSAVLLAGILIGVHKGRIALWNEGQNEPFKVFPYRASMLPDEYEQMLKKGIRVESMDELRRLMEAYLS